jgi:hypothetical protein
MRDALPSGANDQNGTRIKGAGSAGSLMALPELLLRNVALGCAGVGLCFGAGVERKSLQVAAPFTLRA